jgi:hypothetical protein
MDAMVREFFDTVASYFWISLRFIEDHHDDIIAIGTFALAVFTWSLWRATDAMLRVAKEQSVDMKRSIAESARAASAMEEVAAQVTISAGAAQESVATLKYRSALQMRAYLSVQIGGGAPQVREKSRRFEGRPQLKNHGLTPAHKVSYRAKVDILPFPLPIGTLLPSPEQLPNHAAVLAPGQDFTLNAFLEGFVDDADVDKIKSGAPGKGLYNWGTVTYEDIFGVKHYTNFCHRLTWQPTKDDDVVYGFYMPQHNDAN